MLFRSLSELREALGGDDGPLPVAVTLVRGHVCLQRGVGPVGVSSRETLPRRVLRQEEEAEESKDRGGGAGA